MTTSWRSTMTPARPRLSAEPARTAALPIAVGPAELVALVKRGCDYTLPQDRLCEAPALRGEQFCYVHVSDKADEVTDARRLGGLWRRRERTLAVAHNLTGVRTMDDLFRLVGITVLDGLGLENPIARSPLLLARRCHGREAGRGR
jgi:hypothetical protein